ncbi:hypothetical protein AB0L00_18630 [Actinoallomurus sp. NPDC052308]|uniref:hypothetical protein n=1 Tax=Actinoallomurus sp. NPDC052308 TaxID=3155530 RepID=UPI003417DF3A
MNLPFLSGSGKLVTPFSRMHCAYFTACSKAEFAFDPEEPAFESPEPPHPATVRARAAAEAASNTKALFMVAGGGVGTARAVLRVRRDGADGDSLWSMPSLNTEDCCGHVCDFRYARDTPNHRHQGSGARTPAVR